MKVEIGKFVNTHGVKGEIKIKSHSDFTDTDSNLENLY